MQVGAELGCGRSYRQHSVQKSEGKKQQGKEKTIIKKGDLQRSDEIIEMRTRNEPDRGCGEERGPEPQPWLEAELCKKTWVGIGW